MAAKIIVLGSLNGNIEAAFSKLTTLHAKNNFSFALIAGNIFDVDENEIIVSRLLDGNINIPVTTYYTIGTNPLPNAVVERLEKNEDICENLHYLGKRSIVTTPEGVRIVSLGGLQDAEAAEQSGDIQPTHSAKDANSLRGANTADILLTSMWPAGIETNSKATLSSGNQTAMSSSLEIANICAAIKPRYHISFSPGNFFYEREPFYHPQASETSEEKHVTRFISLASFANLDKAKSLYAFNLQAGEKITSLPVGCTPTPFPRGTRRRAEDDSVSYYGRFSSHQGHHDGPPRRRRRERSPPPDPSRCFFCLSNENLERHMLCAVGDHAYLTTAKGPLTTSQTFAKDGLKFPGHQIIIPLPHEPTLRAIAPIEDAKQTFTEMTRFRESLQATLASQSDGKLGAVTWEISRSRNIHYHWQLIPISIEFIRKGLVEAAFKVEAENLGYPLFDERDVGSGIDEQADFLRLWIWSDDSDAEIQCKELVMQLDDSFRFDLQFPRKVLAKLMRLEARLYWQDVAQPTGEEEADAENFKQAYKSWNFTLEA